MSKFMRDFRHTARQDLHVFFAPFVGAVEQIKTELSRPLANNSFKALLIKDMRVYFAPFVGAFKGWKKILMEKSVAR